MTQHQYTAVFEPAPEGGYVVIIPRCPDSSPKAIRQKKRAPMVKDAIRGYIESLIRRGEEIPVEPHPATVERVAVII